MDTSRVVGVQGHDDVFGGGRRFEFRFHLLLLDICYDSFELRKCFQESLLGSFGVVVAREGDYPLLLPSEGVEKTLRMRAFYQRVFGCHKKDDSLRRIHLSYILLDVQVIEVELGSLLDVPVKLVKDAREQATYETLGDVARGLVEGCLLADPSDAGEGRVSDGNPGASELEGTGGSHAPSPQDYLVVLIFQKPHHCSDLLCLPHPQRDVLLWIQPASQKVKGCKCVCRRKPRQQRKCLQSRRAIPMQVQHHQFAQTVDWLIASEFKGGVQVSDVVLLVVVDCALEVDQSGPWVRWEIPSSESWYQRRGGRIMDWTTDCQREGLVSRDMCSSDMTSQEQRYCWVSVTYGTIVYWNCSFGMDFGQNE